MRRIRQRRPERPSTSAVRGAIAALSYAQQPDQLGHGRIRIIKLAGLVGTHELGNGQAGAASHLALKVDTSGLLAVIDARQAQHEQAVAALGSPHPPLLLSPFVLAELDYLVSTRVGPAAASRLLEQVARGALRLETFVADDVERASQVVDAYPDLDIGLTDASLVVLAERHGVADLLSLDEHHFRALAGPHGRPSRLLPADA